MAGPLKPRNEQPLFITDPADSQRKVVGSKQVFDDHIVWFKRVSKGHIMRLGSLGFDAMTYETQFKGKPGHFRVVHAEHIYEVPFPDFEANAELRDYGHGRQYFLGFPFWKHSTVESEVSPLRKPVEQPKLVFGEVTECRACIGWPAGKRPLCEACHGRGFVPR